MQFVMEGLKPKIDFQPEATDNWSMYFFAME